MKNLLLPYALTNKKQLIHINDAKKNEYFFCIECGNQLILKLPKISKGDKHYRKPHFAHKNNINNNCSESILHMLFKDKIYQLIKEKINHNEKLYIEWNCDKCNEKHKRDLIKKSIKVCKEYHLKDCRPDILLFNKYNKPIIAIEIVVTHKPSNKTLKFYKENKIACIQVDVKNFDDHENYNSKLNKPDKVSLCPNPKCEKCANHKNTQYLIIKNTTCYNCNKEQKIALIQTKNNILYSPKDFSEEEIELANKYGANIKEIYSKTMNKSYYANTCKYCIAFIGDNYISDYIDLPNYTKIKTEYICFQCKQQEELHYLKIKTTIESINKDIITKYKTCQNCNGILKLRVGSNGVFYGCTNYPSCRYTQNIIPIKT